MLGLLFAGMKQENLFKLSFPETAGWKRPVSQSQLAGLELMIISVIKSSVDYSDD